MRLREPEKPLDPRAERELDAVDRALTGEPVDPDLAAWEELTALIAEERPDPDPEWVSDLDKRAKAGFRGAGGDGPSRSLAARLGAIRTDRLLAPAGALATLIVVAVVAISTLDVGDGPTGLTSEEAVAPAVTESSEEAGGGTAAAEDVDPLVDPDVTRGFLRDSRAVAPEIAPPPGVVGDSSKIAPGTARRREERDVQLSLSTQPDQVRDVSDQVITITRSLGGIVASSQISEAGRDSSATLQLTLPTRNLDSAIDQLTELANVESLNEASLDITKPYVSAQDTLRDAEARRRSLLEALANADTEAEAAAIQQQIDDARREISRAESAFDNIARRARLSDLSVTVVGDPNAKEDRSLGDWLDDALDVLRSVAGVLLIAAAIVVPIGILITVIWLATRALRRRRREAALD